MVYKQLDGTITEIAKDFSPLWTTAVEMFDDDFYLLSDQYGNLVTVSTGGPMADSNVDGPMAMCVGGMRIWGCYYCGGWGVPAVWLGGLIASTAEEECGRGE